MNNQSLGEDFKQWVPWLFAYMYTQALVYQSVRTSHQTDCQISVKLLALLRLTIFNFMPHVQPTTLTVFNSSRRKHGGTQCIREPEVCFDTEPSIFHQAHAWSQINKSRFRITRRTSRGTEANSSSRSSVLFSSLLGG